MFDSSEARKAVMNILDDSTMDSLLKAMEKGLFTRLKGVVESGKESAVLLGVKNGEFRAVKVYMTRAGGFRDMENYLRGDRRFRDVKSDRRSVVEAWARKEFSNLKAASNQVNCPEVHGVQGNAIVMEFIGKGRRPYPKLKEVGIENPEKALQITLDGVERLWREEELVHGDLSQYNVLVADDRLVWIDFSQGVHESHPQARELLERDVKQITEFFQDQGADTTPEQALNRFQKFL